VRIPELFGRSGPVFSFEFFLPKTAAETTVLFDSIRELKELRPAFVTLIAGLLTDIRAFGIESIVALRGDQPRDVEVPPPDRRDFGYARDLVAFIRERGDWSVAVAGYPEKHPEAPSPEEDMRRLAEKVAAGADWVMTQLFFDNRDYFAFVRRAREAGITVPIVPGIMPVTSYKQLKRFMGLCGASIPRKMAADLEAIQADPEAVVRYGIEHGRKQCFELLAAGVPGIHFYTLNKSRSTREILRSLRG
jgi:methylenetetrahydrofolate reductase (NADPH)